MIDSSARQKEPKSLCRAFTGCDGNYLTFYNPALHQEVNRLYWRENLRECLLTPIVTIGILALLAASILFGLLVAACLEEFLGKLGLVGFCATALGVLPTLAWNHFINNQMRRALKKDGIDALLEAERHFRETDPLFLAWERDEAMREKTLLLEQARAKQQTAEEATRRLGPAPFRGELPPTR